MISTKKHIQQLASLLLAFEINDVVISPGSRNGPLIHTFVGCGKFNTRNIVDERSAAYFAMGLAQAKQKPVVLSCSSGTATLNYAPAIAEAYYLNVPLIVLTADRPEYMINIGESQCIVQKNIYRDFIKKEVGIPLEESESELEESKKLIEVCLRESLSGESGPVHINIPLEEPLHDILNQELPEIGVPENSIPDNRFDESELSELVAKLEESDKVLILAGQQNQDAELENILNSLVVKSGVAVLTEHLSNFNSPLFCKSIDCMMTALLNDKIQNFQPDILITFGGQFVSKSLKQFLRKNKPLEHWHVSASGEGLDTYQALTRVVETDSLDFFSRLTEKIKTKNRQYQQRWKNKEIHVNKRRNEFLQNIDFSDLKAYEILKNNIPEDSVIHLGNSTPVRYALIHDTSENCIYFGNRGTSGIDGCISTAVGFASESEKLNTIIVGDLSFFYDSNAFWNKYIGNNLRIIVLNNGGGNIFGLIKGPSNSPAFNEHFFAENNFQVKGVAVAFNLEYFKAENTNELEEVLKHFYSGEQKHAAILEIITDAAINTKVFRELFKFVKE